MHTHRAAGGVGDYHMNMAREFERWFVRVRAMQSSNDARRRGGLSRMHRHRAHHLRAPPASQSSDPIRTRSLSVGASSIVVMRTAFPAATVAAALGGGPASRPALAFAAAEKEDRAVAVGAGKKKSLARDSDGTASSLRARTDGAECAVEEKPSGGGTDVGILTGGSSCEADEICEKDGTSSLGGRCASSTKKKLVTPKVAAFTRRQRRASTLLANRRRRAQDDRQVGSGGAALANATDTGDEEEEEEFVCPTFCPEEFCNCARSDEGGDAERCAPELNMVCEQDLLAECVPDRYLKFYTSTYCPFAKCLAVDSRPYAECSCDYYDAYCKAYYTFQESMEKCAIGQCCADTPVETKYTCLPELTPTKSPTMTPTLTQKPSASPTDSMAPTLTMAPTSSTAPTGAPSTSSKPTTSAAPTRLISETPSASPTISAAVSVQVPLR
ncbi:hypothetical protein ACHAWF_016547 [Thalassiosira exigua]